jgi:carbon-monoxide dehydrogenase medium subunit
MKAVAFQYERPKTVGEATALLGEQCVFTKAIAGSQSIGPMLNLRLAQPDLLVDITSIAQLADVSEESDHLVVGACVTHANIEDGLVPDCFMGLLRHVAGRIAYRAVRNRGTVGGSVAHADPAADWVSALPLLNAEFVVAGRSGNRKVAARDFLLSSFTTVLETDELIVAVRIPKLSKRAKWGFVKFNQKAGEFAHAIGGVLHDPERNLFRAVIGAIETAPIVVDNAASLFGGAFGAGLAERLDETAVLAALDNKGVKDEYNRQLSLVALKRAAKQACAS